MILFFLLLFPLLATLCSLAVKKRVAILEVLAGATGLIELGLALAIAGAVVGSGEISFSHYLSVDSLSAILIAVVAVVACAASFYSIGYLRVEFKKNYINFGQVRKFFCLFHVFVLAMFVALLAAHPIIMWIAVEATTLSTIALISFYNKPSATEAAWKYLLITSIGLLLGFFGTLLFFTGGDASGLINWQTLLVQAPHLNPVIAQIAFIFVLVGFGTKVGLAPMHTWLPDAHSKAPSPVSALLSGALLNVAFLAILRFKTITDAVVDPIFSQNLLLGFGLLSLGISAFIILVQKKYKRLFAYSSIEHMGIIALGFGIGGVASYAAILHMIYHSLAKSILFLSSGTVFLKYGMSKIANVRGMLSAIPFTAVVLFIGFLAITGVPPFGTFITEFTIIAAGIADHFWITVLMLILLALVFVGFLRHIVSMTFGELPEGVAKGEFSLFTTLPLLALVVLLFVLSIYLPISLKALISSATLSIR